jgi:hypothetical protein
MAGVSANQLLGEQWSAGVGWRWQQAYLKSATPGLTDQSLSRNELPGPQRATLNELWTRLQWQHPLGPFLRAEALWLWQSHDNELFRQSNTPAIVAREYVSQINLQAGWRFKHNRGEFSLGALNLGGGDYRLDPLSGYPELAHERVFFTRLQLNF